VRIPAVRSPSADAASWSGMPPTSLCPAHSYAPGTRVARPCTAPHTRRARRGGVEHFARYSVENAPHLRGAAAGYRASKDAASPHKTRHPPGHRHSAASPPAPRHASSARAAMATRSRSLMPGRKSPVVSESPTKSATSPPWHTGSSAKAAALERLQGQSTVAVRPRARPAARPARTRALADRRLLGPRCSVAGSRTARSAGRSAAGRARRRGRPRPACRRP